MFTAQTISEKSSNRSQKSSAVQPKLKVNKADDSFEKEADAVAERVINTPGIQPLVLITKATNTN